MIVNIAPNKPIWFKKSKLTIVARIIFIIVSFTVGNMFFIFPYGFNINMHTERKTRSIIEMDTNEGNIGKPLNLYARIKNIAKTIAKRLVPKILI